MKAPKLPFLRMRSEHVPKCRLTLCRTTKQITATERVG